MAECGSCVGLKYELFFCSCVAALKCFSVSFVSMQMNRVSTDMVLNVEFFITREATPVIHVLPHSPYTKSITNG